MIRGRTGGVDLLLSAENLRVHVMIFDGMSIALLLSEISLLALTGCLENASAGFTLQVNTQCQSQVESFQTTFCSI